ncbi:MAG: MdtA/MuxA family multidrug efflux RND transporter periplasmic adaptor subunit [Gammaproteobacteria bacterium]|nr:MdtA/MuxA family multidrug efflux RND transporter periplasmic adaptor subunit [Gammaproteobacteria bacterium]MCW5583669.1 MdtA/MuxA family multidrug efflux RND transporter periplasmic adaptor subunit [Gammaproteobacteria bacterium]
MIGVFHYYQGTFMSRHRGAAHPITVVTSTARMSDISVYLSALGNILPANTVTVRTQINGQLMRVLFKEGQMVKEGDLLAEIDARPYLAQLAQYEGQLARDTAQLFNAKVDLKRYQQLWRQDSISQQTLATQQALVKQLEGNIKIDEGLIAETRVNLEYSKITSPINGRIGLRFVDPGNVVQVSDINGLAIVNTLNPIMAVFTIPEDNVAEVMQKVETDKVLMVEAFDRQHNTLLATGKLLAMDNQIDPSTGTVRLKAQFENEQNKLFPNQFVNIQLLVKIIRHATIIPTAAVQYATKGTFVYVLNHDSTVSIKPIVVGVTTGDDTSVKSGIVPGQSVVVEGADGLVDGAKVVRAASANTLR